MESTLLSIADVARLLHVQDYKIAYAHRIGVLKDVVRVGGKRVYGPEDVQRVKDYFEFQKEKNARTF